MNNNIDIDIGKAVIAGLEALNDRDVKVRSDLIEDLAVLKNILNGVRAGNLVIASPDRILPKDAKLPKNEVDN